MIDNFLRPPKGPSETIADLLRLVGVLSFVLALIFFELTEAGVVAFTLPGLMLARFLGMRPWPDILLSVSLLIAAWSNVFALYAAISWWDLAVHFACAGGLAVVSYLFLARAGILPSPSSRQFTPATGITLTTALGLALGVLWEVIEWLGFNYITDDIYVTYDDTITDMVAGGLGALCLSFTVAYLPLLRTPDQTPTPGAEKTPSEGEGAVRSSAAVHPVELRKSTTMRVSEARTTADQLD